MAEVAGIEPEFTQSIQDTAEFGVHIGVHQCNSKGASEDVLII